MKYLLLFFLSVFHFTFANADLSKSNNQFSFHLYEELPKNKINPVFSPFSIQSCLFMTYIGAKELTQIEMQKALFLHLSQRKLPDAYRSLYQKLFQLEKVKEKKALFLANALWIDQQIEVIPVYRFMIQKNFYGNVETINFSDPTKAIQKINDWTSQHTNKKIKQLVSSNNISDVTKMVLTNAAYLKSTWQSPFKASMTYKAPFYYGTTPNQTAHTEMMQQIKKFPYYEDEKMQVLCLPCQTSAVPKNLAMLIFLPKTDDISIDLSDFQTAIDCMQTTLVHCIIPKFSMMYSLDLKSVMMSMGMIKPFTRSADFSGITGRKDLYISDTIHKCFFQITESGIEASAASSISMGLTAFQFGRDDATLFQANRPFQYFIVDRELNLILFMGKFDRPIEKH